MAEAAAQSGAQSQSSQGSGSQSAQGGTTAQSATTSQTSTQQTQQGGQAQTQQQGSQQQAGGQAGAAAKPERPAYVPEQFWDATKGEVKADDFGKHVTDLATFKAADDVRRNALPQKPEDYQLALPKEFQAPQGIEFKFNENDPSLKSAREAAKEFGLTQDQFSKLLGLYAGAQVNQMQTFKEAREAEMAKLGTTATARISSINTFLNGYLGKDEAAALQNTLWSSGIVQAFEKLITKISSSGAGFNQNGRDNSARTVDDATYNSWSPTQRMNYARYGDPNKSRPDA